MINKRHRAAPRPAHLAAPPTLFFLAVLCLALGLGAAGEVRAGEAPPWLPLTDLERTLWSEQGVDQPAPHLLGAAAARSQGAITPLRVVVILVEFPDQLADHTAHPPAHYEQLMFSEGLLPNGSVREFLLASSHGRLDLTGEVRGWFMAPQEKSEYTNGRGGLGFYPLNSQRLAEDALTLADPTINFAHYDNEGGDGVPDSGDDDELVDGFLIVHAGSGREGGSTPNDFISVFWWTPGPVPVDGVFGRFFTLNPEDTGLGILVHELGHLLGLPDLYDTDGGSAGLGQWSMMAGGSLLGQGETPSDFDAWSKVQLGFVDQVFFSGNADDVLMGPVLRDGKVLHLWRNGTGNNEYFLLENRQRTGIDAALPGEGLLLYHVDESIQNNNVPNHYRVALEQADGLFELENRFGGFSFGDAGDPFVAGDVFSRFSTPDNFDYDGNDTFVSIFDIQGPTPGGDYTADIRVDAGPIVEVVNVNMMELAGDGDGAVEDGETAGLTFQVGVTRVTAGDVNVSVRSLDPRGALTDGQRALGNIAAGSAATLADPIPVEIAAGLPSDPYGLKLELTVTWTDGPPRVVPLELGVGSVQGRNDDFETAAHGWSHQPVRPTAKDQWTYLPDGGVDGSAAFLHGLIGGGYRSGTDAALISPVTLVAPGAELMFDQRVDIGAPNPEQIRAGGVVEISVNGGDWQLVEPAGGYPEPFRGESLEWAGRSLFAGRLQGGEFHPVRIDLSPYLGSIRVRFRFFSEIETRAGDGWVIDNVRIQEATVPVRVISAEGQAVGEDVHLTWRLGEPLPTHVRWVRGPHAASAVTVAPGWMRAQAHGSMVDPGARAVLPADYWLEALARDGSRERWGPLAVTPSGAPTAPWRVLANPVRGSAEFTWAHVLPPGARLEIFDTAGRLVHSRVLAREPGVATWSGELVDGRPAPPGVYFARIRGTDLSPLRLVRLP